MCAECHRVHYVKVDWLFVYLSTVGVFTGAVVRCPILYGLGSGCQSEIQLGNLAFAGGFVVGGDPADRLAGQEAIKFSREADTPLVQIEDRNQGAVDVISGAQSRSVGAPDH